MPPGRVVSPSPWSYGPYDPDFLPMGVKGNLNEPTIFTQLDASLIDNGKFFFLVVPENAKFVEQLAGSPMCRGVSKKTSLEHDFLSFWPN